MAIKESITYKVIDKLENNNSISIDLEINGSPEQQMYCIHRSLKNHLTNNRIKKASTKTRSEVSGGGRKPWKQKGTGRARAGSIRSPLWKGGGVIFGPIQRKYTSKINKKEKKLAVNTMLYNKSSKTVCVDEIFINTSIAKTKNALLNLKELGISLKQNNKILIIVENKVKTTQMSFRNLPNIELIESKHINILSLLKADIILISIQAINRLNIK
uniref:Large ribosomal subunit protein uL4c n=1 Tax=Chondria sp. (in: red algae) TaxID=1982705 RepID=A0A1Z1MCE7_9FLOR|nr:ribosomal protein L4 [Chondria sp. (in: red algae)]